MIWKVQIIEIKKKMNKEAKPDWVTDKQWSAVPYVKHWDAQRAGIEYIRQSPTRTSQEVSAQFARLRSEKNWNQGA
jgi:hypothetical protein